MTAGLSLIRSGKLPAPSVEAGLVVVGVASRTTALSPAGQPVRAAVAATRVPPMHAAGRRAAGTLGAGLPGPLLFARFAFPPNHLGLCGPETADPAGTRPCRPPRPELRRIAEAFEGAWPYLQIIAAENGVGDPLDPCVVEAYWLGNGLLGDVGPRARHADLKQRFRPRTATREWPWLDDKAGSSSLVHHSFHVLEILRASA